MAVNLSNKEQRVRDILVRVAEGRVRTHRVGFISYKELWTKLSRKTWGRARKNEIVPWITHISAFDLSQGRPPLSELVVRKGSKEPGERWDSIKSCLVGKFEVSVPYTSHSDAQEACWRYWGRQDGESGDDQKVEEGYKQDRTVTFRSRNASIIAQRKQMDDYTCQVCRFRLEVNGTFIIDCHHKKPLGLVDSATVTELDHLVCLCPTCHRIAHTQRYPLDVDEIRALRGISG